MKAMPSFYKESEREGEGVAEGATTTTDIPFGDQGITKIQDYFIRPKTSNSNQDNSYPINNLNHYNNNTKGSPKVQDRNDVPRPPPLPQESEVDENTKNLYTTSSPKQP
eukprot:GILJ01039720.1.p1 GENE.GILJ01039720.1~~GILJ01039720.1.p1  ORF type:complete len:109 (+),score=23.12 GILJ01039720.1:39-365(+)